MFKMQKDLCGAIISRTSTSYSARDPALATLTCQWHICQLLGDLSTDANWDDNTRHQSLALLHEYAKGNGAVQSDPVVRRWALTLLRHNTEHSVTSAGNTRNVYSAAIMEKKKGRTFSLRARSTKPFELVHPLASRLPLPMASPLLYKVNMDTNVEFAIHRLLRQQSRMYDRRAVYIQLLSKQSLTTSEDDLVELQVRAREFLRSRREVLLILGDSGAGKTTFGMRLENELWTEYSPGRPIPLFIDLKAIETADKDMIHQHLDDTGFFTDQQIEDLRRSRRFVLICDGYDECHNWTNLHTKNRFNKPRNWKVKMIVNCRTQYLGPNYRNYFEPEITTTGNPNFSHTSDLFEEAVIVPFKSSQIREYVELFTQVPRTIEYPDKDPMWSTEQYLGRLRSITHLMELAASPFMLKMILDVLPRIAKTTTKMTRVDPYDRFVELHFELEQRRLSKQHSSGKMDNSMLSTFISLRDNDLIDLGLDFSKRLSHLIFKEQSGKNSVTYSDAIDRGSWKDAFFGSDMLSKLLRQSAQLVCRENNQDLRRLMRHNVRPSRKRNSYEFSHRSMLEYFYSCLIFDPRGNGTCLDLTMCLESSVDPKPIVSHPLGQVNIVPEISIVHFLADRADQSKDFKNRLQAIIRMSKAEATASLAAANAITILVRAGVHFNSVDLQGIQIPGADLTEGQFDFARFHGADLTNTNFTRTWLRHADFAGARMQDVWLGEKPSLAVPTLRSLVVSPDGKKLAAGLDNGDISVFDSQDWELLYTFKGHSQLVSSVTFSNDNGRLASGSYDKTVRVWSLETGNCVHTFKGHSHRVSFVLFSPDGLQVAAVYHRNTFRIWDIPTGAPVSTVNVGRVHHEVRIEGRQLILEYEENKLFRWNIISGESLTRVKGLPTPSKSIAWSPDGRQIAFGGRRGTVKLWNVSTNEIKTLSNGHGDDALSYAFAYSPDGTRLVTGYHNQLYLWDLQTDDNNAVVMEGHTGNPTAAVFSRDGRWIASCGIDSSVILWDGQSGSCIATMNGHSNGVTGVCFLNEHELVSGGGDGMLRFWQIGPEVASSPKERSDTHIKRLYAPKIAYHPTGKYLITAEHDGCVRRWDAETGTSQAVLNTASGLVQVSYSSDGQKLAITKEMRTVIYDTSDETWRPVEELEGEYPVKYSPCGSRMALGTDQGAIRLRNLLPSVEGEQQLLKGPTTRSQKLVFSKSGGWLASISDQGVWIWDMAQMNVSPRIYCKNRLPVDIAFSPCGNTLAIVYISGISLVNVKTLEGRTSLEEETHFCRIAWSNCGRRIIASSVSSTVLWATDSEEWALKLIKVEATPAFYVAWSPTTPMEVAISVGKSVSVWRIEEQGKRIRFCLVWEGRHHPSHWSKTGPSKAIGAARRH